MNTETEEERRAARTRLNLAKMAARKRLFGAFIVPVEEYPSLRDAPAEQPK